MGASHALNKAQRIRLPRPTFDLYIIYILSCIFLHQRISKKLMRHRHNVKLFTVETICCVESSEICPMHVCGVPTHELSIIVI